MYHGVPQGSVLGPILFLIHINDLHRCIKHCTTYHFADDTNLLNISIDYKTLQWRANYDLFSLHKWLTANKISLNDGKTELVYFRKGGKAPNLRIKLHGKFLVPTKFVKYLGVYLDEFLSGEVHCRELIKKLSRTNGMLAKSRHYVPEHHLINIYHAIFSSHLMYGAQVWTPKVDAVRKIISRLQKSALRIITFSEFKAHHEQLCKKLYILKFIDNMELSNCLFVYDFFSKNLPESYVDTFTRIDDRNANSSTRQAATGMLSMPKYSGVTFGLKSIYNKCIISWNKFTAEINKIHKQKFVNKMR
jgi:hypothetical protein